MPELGPAITYRSLPSPDGGKVHHALYALPGDKHWRTVSAHGKAITFATPRDAEAMAGHVLCAKLRQQPAIITEPFRTKMHDLLNDLMDWQAALGGFDGPVWGKVQAMRDLVADPPRPLRIGGAR